MPQNTCPTLLALPESKPALDSTLKVKCQETSDQTQKHTADPTSIMWEMCADTESCPHQSQ